MRVSAPLASLLAATLCLVATTAPTAVHAQNDDLASGSNSTHVFNPADVVQEIVMSDKRIGGSGIARVVARDGGLNDGRPLTPEVRNPFLESLDVTRPFDDLVVTTPNPGPIAVVKVRDGEKFKLFSGPMNVVGGFSYLYGDFLVLRIRTVANEFVSSIRAPPEMGTNEKVTLKHTLSNTKVTSKSQTSNWASEATVTARAEASAEAFGSGVTSSIETSLTVSRSVSTTYASSEAVTEELSKEEGFVLEAPAGMEAALWVSRLTLDVFVCTAPTKKSRLNPLTGTCEFSHTVQEKGNRYEITLRSF